MRQHNIERAQGYDRWRLPTMVEALFEDPFAGRYDRRGTGNGFPEQDVRVYRGKEPLNLWIGIRNGLSEQYLLVNEDGYIYRRVFSFELLDWMKTTPPWNNGKIQIYASYIQFQALTAYWEKDIDAYLERRSHEYAQATP